MAERKIAKKHDDKINKLVSQIVSNSKDAHWAKEMLSELAGLYQMDKVVDVPLREVKDSIDFGPNKLYRTIRGYVWECKGGMTTVVDNRMSRVCTMLNTIFELNEKEYRIDDEQYAYDTFVESVCYVMQCPIFSSLSEMALFENAVSILQTFNKYSSEIINNAGYAHETEDDIRENIESERIAEGLESLANDPIPPED